MMKKINERIFGKDFYESSPLELSQENTVRFVFREKDNKRWACLKFYNNQTEYKRTTYIQVTAGDLMILDNLLDEAGKYADLAIHR